MAWRLRGGLTSLVLCRVPAERRIVADQPDVSERVREPALAVHAPRNLVDRLSGPQIYRPRQPQRAL